MPLKIDIKFKILGKNWIMRVCEKRAYNRKNGKDSVAITRMHRRRIDISPKGRDLETIVHEITHAYLYELCLHSADLDVVALEEVFAELMAKYGKELLGLAEELTTKVAQSLTPGTPF